MSAPNSPTTPMASTARSSGDNVVQFSIFLRNKVGALLDIVRLLNEHHIQVLATAIEAHADTAIVRVVVSDPEGVEGIFHLHTIPFTSCPLVVVEFREAAQFGDMLAALLAAEVNIFGAYALLMRPHGLTALALHVEDNECAVNVLSSSGFTILTQHDLSR